MAAGLVARLPDGRLHLQEGPIDLLIGFEGPRPAVQQAVTAASTAFAGLLAGLAAELPLLRTPVGADLPAIQGPVGRRMVAAVWPHRRGFITPMAAVAGAVADEVLAAIAAVPGLTAAHVNNGGDIALYLTAGASLRIGLVRDQARAAPEGLVRLSEADGIGGVATSGWPGRSFSLGIANAVTVLARNAAAADAAATVIANAVNADHPAIARAPAETLDPDSDLGARLVTTAVGALPPEVIAAALAAGEAVAEALIQRGLIAGALLALQGETLAVGLPRLLG